MMKNPCFLFLGFLFILNLHLRAQQKEAPTQPLPPYGSTPYGTTTPDDVKRLMDRIFVYVDEATPFAIVNRETGAEIVDVKKVQKEATLKKSEYSISSHEWGLAYTSMLATSEVTGDSRYIDYVKRRSEE